MGRIFSILFLFVAFTCLTSCISSTNGEHFVVFQTTDIHGNIGNESNPGLMQIASEIRKQRKSAGKNTLWIDCGDLTAGTTLANSDQGASMVDAFNKAGCDIFVPGNHEFDYGREILIRNLNAFHGTVLGANLKIRGYDKLMPWTLIKRGNYRIAVIGIVTPFLPQITRNAQSLLEGIEVTSAEEAIERHLPDIMKSKPNVIVLAIHVGELTDQRFTGMGKPYSLSEIAIKYPQINLILCGHSHSTISGKRLESGAWLTQAPAQGKDAVRIDLQMNQGNLGIDSISSKLLGVTGTTPVDKDLQEIFVPVQK